LEIVVSSGVGAEDVKIFWAKLIRFGQIWFDLGKTWAKLRRNVGKSD